MTDSPLATLGTMIVWLAAALCFLMALLGIANARRRRRASDEESAPLRPLPTPLQRGSAPAGAKARRGRLRRRLPS